MDRDDAVALLAKSLVDLSEVAGGGRRRFRQLGGRRQLLKELLVGEVDAVLVGLVPEVDAERDNLDAVLLAPGLRQVRRGVGDDSKPTSSQPGAPLLDRDDERVVLLAAVLNFDLQIREVPLQ